MSDTTHTPTPWTASQLNDPRWWGGAENGWGFVTLGGNDEANAKFIVECVNQHDDLVASNASLTADRDALLTRLETMARIFHHEVHDDGTVGLTCPLPICQKNDRIIKEAQAERGE